MKFTPSLIAGIALTSVFATAASAELIGTGIVQDVTVSVEDIGGGFDAVTITVDTGTSEFTVIEGGFTADNGADFNFNPGLLSGDGAIVPSGAFFSLGAVAADHTIFAVADEGVGDASILGGLVGSGGTLQAASIGFPGPVSGTFDLARLILPNGGSATVASSLPTALDTFNLLISGSVVGTISGTTAAIAPGVVFDPVSGTVFDLTLEAPTAVVTVDGAPIESAVFDDPTGIFTLDIVGNTVEVSLNDAFDFSTIAPGTISTADFTITAGGESATFTASTAVPEPTALALVGLGIAGVVARRRRS